MRWPFRRRSHRGACPSEDARCSLEQANRSLEDAQRLGRTADDLRRRADEVADRWRETREINHVAEAVIESIKRKARHS